MSKHFGNMKVFMLYPITAVDVSDQSDRALEGGVSFNLIHARWLDWSMSPACSRFLVRCVQYCEHQLLFMCPAARETRLCARLWLQCCVVLGANWRSWTWHCWYWWWCFSGSRRHLGTRDSVNSKSVFSRYHLICFGCFLLTEFLTGFLSFGFSGVCSADWSGVFEWRHKQTTALRSGLFDLDREDRPTLMRACLDSL